MWKVRCRCGTVKDVEGKRLRNGEAQSCGCSHFLRPFEALHNVLISRSAQRPIEVLSVSCAAALLTRMMLAAIQNRGRDRYAETDYRGD